MFIKNLINNNFITILKIIYNIIFKLNKNLNSKFY